MLKFVMYILLALVLGGGTFNEGAHKLREGSTPEQVKELLGEPEEVRTKGPRVTYVYSTSQSGYDLPYYVQFTDNKLSGWGHKKEEEQQAQQRAIENQNRANQMRNIGNALGDFGNALNQNQQRRSVGKPCSGYGAAPVARIGCKYSCINGQWSEICGGR